MSQTTVTHEHLSADHQHLLCWSAVAGGVLITVAGFIMLTALGAGVAGYTANGMVAEGEGGSALLTGAGLWLGLSALISLFCGSYFTLRVTRFQTAKVGAAHGFVVASLFFALMFFVIGSAVGGLAGGLTSLVQGTGKLAMSAGNGAAGASSSLSASPAIQDLVHKAVGASKLKSDPREVAEGVVVRLAQGDTESLKSYIAYQTDIPESEMDQKKAELDRKVEELKTKFDENVKKAGEAATRAAGHTGLTLFVLLLVGMIAAVLGGRTGALANVDRPFARPGLGQRGSVVPYLLGWLVGVPVSLLVLIAALRTLF